MLDDLDEAPRCPVCGAEMVPEPFIHGNQLAIAYSCSMHGPQLLVDDPFDAS